MGEDILRRLLSGSLFAVVIDVKPFPRATVGQGSLWIGEAGPKWGWTSECEGCRIPSKPHFTKSWCGGEQSFHGQVIAPLDPNQKFRKVAELFASGSAWDLQGLKHGQARQACERCQQGQRPDGCAKTTSIRVRIPVEFAAIKHSRVILGGCCLSCGRSEHHWFRGGDRQRVEI